MKAINKLRGSFIHMPMFVVVLIETLLQYVTLVNVAQNKYKFFELLAAWSATGLLALLAFYFGAYDLFINFGMFVIFTVFLNIKTRNIAISVLFSAVASVICMTAKQMVEPLIPVDFLEGPSRYALIQFLTFIISFIIGRLLKTRLGDLARSSPKGGIVRYIVGGTLIALGMFYVNIFLAGQIDRTRMIAVTSFLLAGYMVFLIAAVHAFVSSRSAYAEMENLKGYTAQIEEMYTELRHFKHDHVNILSSLYGYAQNNDLESLRKYLLDRLMPYSRSIAASGAGLERLVNIKMPELKGLLSLKIFHARRLGMEIIVEAASPVTRAGMNTVDLIRVVGILIDNAIEASEEKKNSIRVTLVEDENGLMFSVSNKTDDTLDLSSVFQKGFSTKGKNRGNGLYNLRLIVGQYSNAALTVKNENGEAEFQLEVGHC